MKRLVGMTTMVGLASAFLSTQAMGYMAVADYGDDYVTGTAGNPTPAAGWSYFWNDAWNEPLDPTQWDTAGYYTDLFWNTSGYYDAGNPGMSNDDAYYLRLHQNGGSPGEPIAKGWQNRAVVAGYTLSQDYTDVRIIDSLFEHTGLTHASYGNALEFRVYLNENLLFRQDDLRGDPYFDTMTFDMYIGDLTAGDSFYMVAIPDVLDGDYNGQVYGDWNTFNWDWTIAMPEPTSALLLAFGGLALLRRRRGASA
ncbi:MAG: PEP-CTERM sorting domain-containing protein [Candidatus Pacebacteria bacterium]|nr:PEP-CTERM sorting domain-containing protein [Candidatus Paceibacterota bacterium]